MAPVFGQEAAPQVFRRETPQRLLLQQADDRFVVVGDRRRSCRPQEADEVLAAERLLLLGLAVGPGIPDLRNAHPDQMKGA